MAARNKDLSQLAALRASLEREAGERLRIAAEKDRAAQDLRRAASEFRDAVAGVTPLKEHGRVEHASTPPSPLPHKRWEDDEQVLIASVSDEFEIDTLLQTDDELSFQRPGVGADVLRKLRRGGWVIQDEVDLHGCRVDEARELLVIFLRDALKQGLRCVRIIHGKGLGSRGRQPVLKGKARTWLAQREEVIAFCQARPAEGGSGALVVLLRPAARAV